MFRHIVKDIKAAKERDPAATSTAEILLTYSGLHAIWYHRLNSWLYRRGLRLVARIGSQSARFLTGIEIHPGATIGDGFFIDHGMGVVIGETTEIGENVTLYQGVTLGGTGKEKGKRHPTVRDNVVVGVGAKVLGPIEIGESSKIGAGAVVLNPVPPNSTAVGVPARVVVQEGQRVDVIDLHHERMPDPVLEMFKCLQHRTDRLQRRVEALIRDTAAADEAPVDDEPEGTATPGGSGTDATSGDMPPATPNAASDHRDASGGAAAVAPAPKSLASDAVEPARKETGE